MLASLDSLVISPLLVNHASWLMLLTQAYFTISSCSFSAVSRVLLSNSWSEPKVSGFCCFILKAFKKPKKPKTKCQTWFFYCKEFTANETCLSFNQPSFVCGNAARGRLFTAAPLTVDVLSQSSMSRCMFPSRSVNDLEELGRVLWKETLLLSKLKVKARLPSSFTTFTRKQTSLRPISSKCGSSE